MSSKKKIFKYTLPKKRKYSLSVPEGAEFLRVGVQNDPPDIFTGQVDPQLVLWAKVDPAAAKREVKFRSIPTGSVSPGKKYTYLETVQMQGQRGPAVFHIFYRAADLDSEVVQPPAPGNAG